MFCADAMAQDPYYVSINKSAGLPSNSIYDLFQDSKGFIWIANNEGLSRYDGFEFKTYKNPRQTSLSGNQIEEDKHGRIWYKNFDGYLYYVEDDSLKALKQNTSIGNTGYAILDDRLVVLQKGGVDFYDLKALTIVKSFHLDIGLLANQVHYGKKYYLLLDDTLCAVASDGSYTCEPINVNGLMCGTPNGILIITKFNTNKFCYEFSGGKLIKQINAENVGFVHELEYCDRKYWLSSPNGVWVLDEDGKYLNGGKPYFADKSISSVLKDREGNFWLGTLDEGILLIPDIRSKFASFSGFVPCVLAADKENVLVGTKNNEIYSYNVSSGKFTCQYKDSLRHEIVCLLLDTVGGYCLFSTNKFFVTDTNLTIRIDGDMAVKDVVAVDEKYYAAATNGSIMLVRVRQNIKSNFDSLFAKYWKKSNQKYSNEFSHLIEACRGRTVSYNRFNHTIYGGTSKGLFAIRAGSITEVKYNEQRIYARRQVFFNNNVFVVTPQSELFCISADDVVARVMLVEEKELCYNLKSIGGELFILTNNGLRTIDPTTNKVQVLKLQPGIKVEEINDMTMIGGQFIFSTERGLIVVERKNDIPETVEPSLVINKMLVNGCVASNSNVFSYKENDVEIHYSVLSFRPDKRYHLYYKINDGKWQINSDVSRVLKLASLSPGDYTVSFRVGVAGSSRYYSEHTILFKITKPFWLEWWFISVMMLLIFLSGIIYYQRQTRLLKRQNQLVVEKVELEKNLRNSMLTSIRSQMNPHFFYNALNAIQSFIFSDDKRNASTYLVKLSKLTRMILEMSEKENITLDEEIEALKLYLELEKIRFNTDFNYELLLDKSVDAEIVRIPPMIVQPYVENAIKHGLLHKKGNKYLSIDFRRYGEDLIVNIDDNGIGREKAGELKQQKREKHNSFSTDANSKRIDLLNKGRRKNIGVVFADKRDEAGNAAGTTVTITIPLT